MVPLSGGQELLVSAAGYALAGARLAEPRLLSRPTPCQGWDLEMLLDHLTESVAALEEALATGGVAACPSPGRVGRGLDPVARLRGQAARLLAASAAGSAGGVVRIGDRGMTARMLAVTGAIEIAVHGWDISVACGACRPIPPALAAVLLPIAPLLVTAGTRPGLFADPVRPPDAACHGDRLVAFLGRRPRVAAPSGLLIA